MAEVITRNLPVVAGSPKIDMLICVEEETKDLEPGDVVEFRVVSEKRIVSEKHNNAKVVEADRNPFTGLIPDRHALKRREEEVLEDLSMHFPDRRTFNRNKTEIKEFIIQTLSAEEQRILRQSEQYVRKMTFNPKIDELKEQRKKIMAKVNYKLKKLSNKLYGDR